VNCTDVVVVVPQLTVGANGTFTVIVTVEFDTGHGAFVMDHCKTYEPAPPAGVNTAVGLAVLLNCVANKLGPLLTVHAPTPTAATFAAKVAVPELQIDCAGPALDTVGGAVTVIVTVDVEAGHGALVIDHCKTYEPAPPAGVNTAVGLAVLLNCVANKLGPLVTVHAPTPTAATFAAKVAVPELQIVWAGPALDTVGGAVTVIVTVEVDAGHGAFVIDHCKTYEPAPPAGVNTAVGLAVLLNCVANKLGPLVTVHAPTPTTAAFAASVAVDVLQIVWAGPALDTVGGAVTVIVTVEVDAGHGAFAIDHCKT